MEFDVGVNRIEKGNVVSTTTIPLSKLASLKEERLTTLKMLMRKRSAQKETTRPIEVNESPKENNGLSIIPNDNVPLSAPTTIVNPQPSYQKHLESYDLVGSDSVRLIDESAKHLHERMTSTGSVVEAALCANQIVKLLRLKLDIRVKTRE